MCEPFAQAAPQKPQGGRRKVPEAPDMRRTKLETADTAKESLHPIGTPLPLSTQHCFQRCLRGVVTH